MENRAKVIESSFWGRCGEGVLHPPPVWANVVCINSPFVCFLILYFIIYII